MDDEFLLILIGLAVILVPPVLGIIAFVRTGRLRRELAELRQTIAALQGGAPVRAPAPESLAAEDGASLAPLMPEPAPVVETPADIPLAVAAPPLVADLPAAAPRESFEQRLTQRWAVWAGGLALALGGIFLVKYSIDLGLLGPGVRVMLGVLLGLGLIGFGAWLRLRPAQGERLAALNASYVPPTITASGICIVFASIYAAYALYEFLPPLLAFLLLAAVSGGAVALALLQGPVIALLGLVGAFVVPALISTDQPSAWTFFPYLAAVIASCVAIVRYVPWRWLVWVGQAGAAIWVLIWFAGVWTEGDALPVGGFLLLFVALYAGAFLHRGDAIAVQSPPALWLAPPRLPELSVWTAALIASVLMLPLVRMDSYGTVSLAIVFLFAIGLLTLAWRDPDYDQLPFLSALQAGLLLFAWHVPQLVETWQPFGMVEGRATGFVPGDIVPPSLERFLTSASIFGALYAAAGFVAVWRLPGRGRFASLSVAAPLAYLALAYWRIEDLAVALPWTAVALGLAALSLIAAERVLRHRDVPGMDAALAAYAVGVVAALSLAMGMTFRDSWLTVALSLQIPAIAWIHARLNVSALRGVALAVALVVLVRLLLNQYVAEYALGALPVLNAYLYAYGLPALAFFVAARMFRASADDYLVAVLETGALAFSVVLVTLEIRHWASAGDIGVVEYRRLEQALQSNAWLAMAYAQLWVHSRYRRPVLDFGWRIVGAVAAAHILVMHLFVSNPLFTGDSMGAAPVANILFLLYALPAIFGVLFFRALRERNEWPIAIVAGVGALILGFVYVSLEVTRAFEAVREEVGTVTDGEWYAYSVVWILYGAALLAIGIWRGYAALRYASLAVLGLTVAKVFLFDMSELTGLLRAVSFLGLGASLVGLGYFYQRFVFPPKAPALPKG